MVKRTKLENMDRSFSRHSFMLQLQKHFLLWPSNIFFMFFIFRDLLWKKKWWRDCLPLCIVCDGYVNIGFELIFYFSNVLYLEAAYIFTRASMFYRLLCNPEHLKSRFAGRHPTNCSSQWHPVLYYCSVSRIIWYISCTLLVSCCMMTSLNRHLSSLHYEETFHNNINWFLSEKLQIPTLLKYWDILKYRRWLNTYFNNRSFWSNFRITHQVLKGTLSLSANLAMLLEISPKCVCVWMCVWALLPADCEKVQMLFIHGLSGAEI